MSETTDRIGAWPMDEPFPALLTDADLRRVLNVSSATFYRLKKLRRFTVLIAEPVLTPTVRYSGAKVAQWVKGELTHARTFGAKRGAA